jgi:hypothetical protein
MKQPRLISVAPNAGLPKTRLTVVMKSDLEKITAEDFPISDEWMKEIRLRCLEIDHGEVQLIEGESALGQLQKKYS